MAAASTEVEYEAVLCVKPDVSVFRIPPRASNRGYRASDWKLDQPDWTGRLRITSKGKIAYIKLEDKVSDFIRRCVDGNECVCATINISALEGVALQHRTNGS